MTLLSDVKTFLGIKDDIQDALLTLIIKDSEDRILSVLNRFALKNGTSVREEIPEELGYIQRDVAIKRFNKINSEGTISDSEEGRSHTWEPSYLDEYLAIFDEYTKPNISEGRGIARFF